MIQQNRSTPSQEKLLLSIIKEPSGEFRIESWKNESTESEKTIIISDRNPNLLWNLLYDLMGVPLPKLPDPTQTPTKITNDSIPEKELEEKNQNKVELEKELRDMAAIEIVHKVLQETGIQITNSLKSKQAILNKALKLLGNK